MEILKCQNFLKNNRLKIREPILNIALKLVQDVTKTLLLMIL